MTTTLFSNANLFDGESDSLLEGYSVLVEGDRIREVSDREISSPSARVIDCRGKTLMPGLIDAHYHALAAGPNFRALQDLSAYELAQHARVFLEASLQRGFTSIRDAGGADFGLAVSIESGLIKGPRLFYAGKALTQTGGHADFRSRTEAHPALCACGADANFMAHVADGVDEVRRYAREELRKGATQIKIMASGGVSSPSDPIWNLQYSEEEIRAAVWEAQSWQRYVMAHAYTPDAIRRCVDYGVRSVEHANLIDAKTAAFVAEKGAYVVPTLVTYDRLEKDGPELGLPKVSLEKLKDIREVGLESLEILKAAGVKVGFGTDLLGAMHQHQSSEFTIRAEALSPVEVLKQATSINGALLQHEGELGVVTTGAFADLLVVEGDPTKDISLLVGQGEQISAIMKGGNFAKLAA